jgi:Holliday junction resolvase RusA-like endonuclease
MTDRRHAIEGITYPITRPDIDNFVKVIFDALNKIVFEDDSQIVEEYSRKVYAANPGVLIEIAPLGTEVARAFRPLRMSREMIGEAA